MIFHQNWQGCRIVNGVFGEKFKAEVPGNIQYDYGVANNFKDVYYADGCRQYEALEDDAWEYSTSLEYTRAEGERIYFVSKGIDYKYEIFLNGEKIYANEGMYTPVELDITDKLYGDDILAVRIAPHPKRKDAPKRSRDEADHSAKPPVCYGWDWNPRLLVSGMYRDAYIETRRNGYIKNCEFTYELSEDFSYADVKILVDCEKECTFTLTDMYGNTVYSGKEKEFRVDTPNLWWCNGEGEPYLYSWRAENDEHSVTGTLGFRRVRLLRNIGANEVPVFPMGCYPAPITLELNGRRIFMKGSNFVNADIFPGRTSEAHYEELVRLAKEGNMNIFRMWGGSGPMHECFYDVCDRMGMLVWQEFMLACLDYPDDKHYLDVLKREAKSIIFSLRHHACLALWCGGNELFNGWSGMDEQSLPLRLLDKLCYEYDNAHPFLKTSPIMGMAHGGYVFYNEKMMGGDIFTAFQRAHNTAYTEFGVPSIAPLDVLKKIIPENEIFPIEATDSYVLHHAKRAWGEQSWACVDILEQYFGKPHCIEDMISESNWLQCEGYRAAFEEARRQWPHCSAAINWVYNEPWYTAANNSLIIYPTAPKPAYYAVKSALRPVIFSARIPKFDWRDGEKFKAEIWLLNDSNLEVDAKASVSLKIGEKKISLLDNLSASCAPKSNVECVSVCCVLPKVENAEDIKLIIESNDEYSNEYRLRYVYEPIVVKEKKLNDA